MRFIRRYLIPRLIQYVLVTVLGITLIFILPRLMPVGPVEKMVANIQARGTYLDPKAAEETIRALKRCMGWTRVCLSNTSASGGGSYGRFRAVVGGLPHPGQRIDRHRAALDVLLTPHLDGVGLYHRESIGWPGRALQAEQGTESGGRRGHVPGPDTLLHRGPDAHHPICLPDSHISYWGRVYHRRQDGVLLAVHQGCRCDTPFCLPCL